MPSSRAPAGRARPRPRPGCPSVRAPRSAAHVESTAHRAGNGGRRVRSITARDFQNIAEASARYQCGPGAMALDERIDDESSAVVDEGRLSRFDSGLSEAVENPAHEVVISGWALGINHLPGFVI